MIDFKPHIEDFFKSVGTNQIEIYNEFSLQHELSIHLRAALGTVLKVQFERPADYFNPSAKGLEKKEIDIVAFTPDKSEKYAIELKYPRHGQYPERMFKTCQDIHFVEQLCGLGFSRGFSIMVADDPLFWNGPEKSGIYCYFRGNTPIHGHIGKPTGEAKGTMSVTVDGNYSIKWNVIDKDRKYALVEILPIKR